MTIRTLTAVVALLAISVSEQAASAGLNLSFKLDQRLTSGMFMGERWVSPPVFHSTLQPGRKASVVVRATASSAPGKAVEQAPQWEVEDSEHVTISNAKNGTVNLTVRGVGKSIVVVSIGGESTTLIATSTYDEESETTKLIIEQEK